MQWREREKISQNQKSHSGLFVEWLEADFSPRRHIVVAFLRAQIIAISENVSIFAFAFECTQPTELIEIDSR